ncbi:Allergen Fus c 3 [Fusarium albosuccineum]|uniref:Allergen Fus c 3 n=1 Tax=Fusarium albosuccineum TaxID=1237068 RepID=A0A8H4KRJ1_9HYPO|nr:Allergen Fus c 3 [Fusarium albosuccineum]
MKRSLTLVASVGTDDDANATRSFSTSTAHSIAESNQPRSAAAARPDRDRDPPTRAGASPAHGAGPSHGAHSVHPTQGPAALSAAGFANQIPPESTGPMPLDWGLYSIAHPSLHLNPTHFDFEVPGTMIPATDGTVGHHSHLPHASTDPAFAYGGDLVSPSSIHSSAGHYDSGAHSHWDDAMSHEAITPKVTTPAGHVTNNPWAELDEPAEDNNTVPASRSRKTPRARRQKKDTRKSSEASQGGSSSAGGGAPSVSDAASPSSVSQHSRASIGSKAASMASTASTTSSRQSKLRSASRTSKNSRDKPNDTPEERRTRASHNLVEKQYRNRLNAQFESLLSALPDQARHGGNGNGDDNESDGANEADRRVSKGEVLEMARKHIQTLERERNQLELENLELQGSLRQLKGSASDGTVSSSGQETPLNFNASTDKENSGEDPDKD